MLIKKKTTTDNFSVQIIRGNYHFSFSNSFSASAKEFEDKRIRSQPKINISFLDDSNISREILWPNLSHKQSYRYIDHLSRPYYLLQASNMATNRDYQMVIAVEESRFPLFKKGIVHQWIMRSDSESVMDLQEMISEMVKLCRIHTPFMSLRIHPYMAGAKELRSTYDLLSSIGFTEVAPQSIIKTRMIDLRPSIEELLKSFSGNGRARLKIKAKDMESVVVKIISDLDSIPDMQMALNASFIRSSRKNSHFNFLPLFLRAKQFCSDVIMLGFYFLEASTIPKAFITGIGHDNIIEYSAGGSLSDSKLRQFPFNHILLWQLALRSKESGYDYLDMGGISESEDLTELSGITRFKRFFPGFELSTGREMEIILKPKNIFIYSMLQKMLNLHSFFRRFR